MRYLDERDNPDEVIAYFMTDADGPCRFGQYSVFLENHIRRNRLDRVTLFSLTCENGYAGMSTVFTRRAWLAFSISDGLDDLYAALLTLAEDREEARAAFARSKEAILRSLAADPHTGVLAVLQREMAQLGRLRKKHPLRDAAKVTLAGEIFVRRDDFSRQFLVEKLARQGIVARTSPLAEWLHYCDYCVTHGLATRSTLGERLKVRLKSLVMRRDESGVQNCLSLSGFMARGSSLINPELSCEAILTVSSALAELGDETHGVISIGPFGCMPCRIAESILTYRLVEEKDRFSRHSAPFWARNKRELSLPFLAIESDGTSFPQVVEARLESFVLAVHRLRDELAGLRPAGSAHWVAAREHGKISDTLMGGKPASW
jgi:predicted nucleotide-binding protein (sugar kinase/HSP70/actin superfamily)